jgi:hypothetical protein
LRSGTFSQLSGTSQVTGGHSAESEFSLCAADGDATMTRNGEAAKAKAPDQILQR